MVQSQELNNKNVNIVGQDETTTLEEVYDICQIKNMTNKTIEEADQYVVLVGKTDDRDYVLSLRKRSDLNKELFTIKISSDEYRGTK